VQVENQKAKGKYQKAKGRHFAFFQIENKFYPFAF